MSKTLRFILAVITIAFAIGCIVSSMFDNSTSTITCGVLMVAFSLVTCITPPKLEK